jgi:hypothetical protein
MSRNSQNSETAISHDFPCVRSGSRLKSFKISSDNGQMERFSSSCTNLPNHSSSGSVASKTTAPSVSGDESDGADYGIYEDFEDHQRNNGRELSIAEILSSNRQRRQSRNKSQKESDLSRMIVYTVKINSANISCRSFDKSSLIPSNVSVCISLTGVRIVQDSTGLHPEFHVVMSVGDEEIETWKILHDFAQVANACMEFSRKNRKVVWPSSTSALANGEVKYIVSQSKLLGKTVAAWRKVLAVTSKRNWFGRVSVASSMAESRTLEHFIECLLFEIPDIDILLEFLC